MGKTGNGGGEQKPPQKLQPRVPERGGGRNLPVKEKIQKESLVGKKSPFLKNVTPEQKPLGNQAWWGNTMEIKGKEKDIEMK